MNYRWDVNNKRIKRKAVTESDLLQNVCDEFECTLEELLSYNREKKLVSARFTAAFLFRKYFKYTVTHIAKILQRDHSTIVIALRRVDDLLFVKDSISKAIVTIETKLFKPNQR